MERWARLSEMVFPLSGWLLGALAARLALRRQGGLVAAGKPLRALSGFWFLRLTTTTAPATVRSIKYLLFS